MRAHTLTRRTVLLTGLVAGATTLAGTPMPQARALVIARLDIRDFGAKSSSTFDNTQAVRNALTEAARRAQRNLLGVVEVLVPEGSFRVDSLRLTSRVQLVGSGSGSKLVCHRTIARWLGTATDARSAAIRSLTLDSAGRVSDCTFYVDQGTSLLTVNGVQFINSGTARPLTHLSTDASVTNLTVQACGFRGSQIGVRLNEGPSRTTIESTTFSDWTEGAIWSRGTATRALSTLSVQDCIIGPPTVGGTVRQPVQIQGSDLRLHRAIKIVGNTVTGNYRDYYDPTVPGTADLISLHRCDGFVVDSNVVQGGGDVGITISQQSRNGRIERNTVRMNGSAGICVGSGTSSFVRNIVVSSNQAWDNGQIRPGDRTSIETRAGIHVRNGDGVQITSNRASNSAGNLSQAFGLTIVQSQVAISGNDFTGNTEGGIHRR